MFQKKKEETPKIIELSENDIKKIKEKLTANEKSEEYELKVKDLKIKDLLPQVFENVSIFIVDGHHTLILNDGMDGPKYKTFKKSRQGFFMRDSLRYHRGKSHGKYVLIEGQGIRKIVRLIEDKELFIFQTYKLINGIIKDKPYMLLKELQPNQKFTEYKKYIKENSEHEIEPEETININVTSVELEDDYDSIGSSVSLFDE